MKSATFNLRDAYATALSMAGLLLITWGIFQIPDYAQPFTFFLLLILAIATQSTMTSLAGGTVTVSVSTAISMATVPLYGPVAAAMVATAAEIGLWVISIRADNPGWKRAAERLGVNVGMNSIAVFCAGQVYLLVANWAGNDTIWAEILPWILASLVGDQVNLWLLTVIIYLAHGVNPLEVWRENRWVIPINVLVMSAGGGLLAQAVGQFNLLGVAIFFLPILLSAYAFRLTANSSKEQMAQLEDLVSLRTQALAYANEKLEVLHKDKDAFLAVLTHDMRTPLTSIKGYTSILRDRDLPREQQIHISKIILRNQDALLEIVNNMLEIEKLQSGTPVLLERSIFDLALLVKAVVELIASQAIEKNITLQYEAVPSPVEIRADEKKIQRVLMNLISNAIKYTPEGGDVAIDTQVNGRYACVEVKDTGLGIPADELPLIFDRYSRVKKHQTVAIGTGLGLAIVKSLVEAHDGEILVTSEENVGSIFTVKLPVK